MDNEKEIFLDKEQTTEIIKNLYNINKDLIDACKIYFNLFFIKIIQMRMILFTKI